MAPWALWMGRCNQSGGYEHNKHPICHVVLLPQKWVSNGREKDCEPNKSIIIICNRKREFLQCMTVIDVRLLFNTYLELCL